MSLLLRLPPGWVRKAAPPASVSPLPPLQQQAWADLHAVADAATPGLRALVLQTWHEAEVTLPLATLMQLTSGVGTTQAQELALMQAWQEAVGTHFGPKLQQQLQDLFVEGAQASIPALRANLQTLHTGWPADLGLQADEKLQLVGDLMGPRAATFARVQGSALITQMTDQHREAIRIAVAQAMARGTPIGLLTQEIRGVLATVPVMIPPLTPGPAAAYEQAALGLLPRQVTALGKFREGLWTTKGMTEAKAEAAVLKKGAQMRRQRAELIARTESMTAAAAGQQALWQQSAAQGLLDTTRVRRRWVITPDDRLCPGCGQIPSLNPQGVALQEPFKTPYGPVMHPAAHPRCRCAVVLVFDLKSPLNLPELVNPVVPKAPPKKPPKAKAPPPPPPPVKAPPGLVPPPGAVPKTPPTQPPPGPGAPGTISTMPLADAKTTFIEHLGGTTGAERWTGADGIDRAVKRPRNPQQGYVEAIANRAYTGLGLAAPESVLLTEQGQLAGIGNGWIAGGTELGKLPLTKARAREILQGYVGDVWLKNWDVIGLDQDNIQFVGDRAIRIDNGGSLLFRAQGGRKPGNLHTLEEWDTFRDPAVNKHYAEVFRVAALSAAEEQALWTQQGQALARLRQETHDFADLVPRIPGVTAEVHDEIVQMLRVRATLIADKLHALDQGTAGAPSSAAAMKQLMGHDYADFLADLKTRPGYTMATPQRLDEHEMVAINAYSSTDPQWSYKTINRGFWRGETPEEETRYQALGRKLEPLSTALHTGLSKAVEAQLGLTGTTLYRGSNKLPRYLTAQYKVGNTITFEGFASTSTSEEVAWSFGTMYHYVIESAGGGIDIKPFSQLTRENEVLYRLGSTFTITRMETRPNPSGSGQTVWLWLTDLHDTQGGTMPPPKKPRRRRIAKATPTHQEAQRFIDRALARQEARGLPDDPELAQAQQIHVDKTYVADRTVTVLGRAPDWLLAHLGIDPRDVGKGLDDV